MSQSSDIHTTIHHALAVAAERLAAGGIADAEAIAREVIRQETRCFPAYVTLAAALRRMGRLDETREVVEQAIRLDPSNAALALEQANVLRETGEIDQALAAYRRTVELAPDMSAAYTNLAAALQQADRLDEAEGWSIQAAERNPTCKIAQYNMGNLRLLLGQLEPAKEFYRRAIALDSAYAQAHWNLGVCHLLSCEFAEGWRGFEWRVAAGEVTLDQYTQPRWDGSSLAGKTLLVHAEQGIGDEVLFASCFGDVVDRAAHVIVTCDTRLAPLFRRSFPRATVYGWQRRKDWSPAPVVEPVDFQVAAGSLPLRFRMACDQFPRRAQYLTPDRDEVESWRATYAKLGQGLKVGIAWRAGGRLSESHRRTIPLAMWRDILSVEGVRFVNLQYGDTTDELRAVADELGVTVHDDASGDPLVSLDGYAAKIAALDFVISVGNATVHLAGAVGTETLALLPHVPSWRWQMTSEECAWYSSVRLLRQSTRGCWDDVLAEAERRLRAKAGGAPTTIGGLLRVARTAAMGAAQSAATLPKPPHAADIADHAGIARALADAVANHTAGRLEAAEAIYRDILRVAPRHADALHLLGVLGRQTARAEMAVRSIRRAIAVDPNVAAYHYNLGSILSEGADPRQAVESLTRAIELEPEYVDAWVNLGVALQKVGEHVHAIACFEQALSRKRDCADTLLNLGISQRQLLRIDDAIASFQRALAVDPHHAKAWNALGAAHLEDRRVDEAIACMVKAIDNDPSYATAHANLATAYWEVERWDEAEFFFQKAIELDRGCFAAYTHLATRRARQARFDGAIELLTQALAIRPDCADTTNNLCNALRDLGRFAEALDLVDRALEKHPLNATLHATRALTLLQLGRFEEGWREYEWRWRCAQSGAARNQFQQPAWDGASLEGKTILVHGEQGVGDEIMFASCFPDLVQCAHRVVVACDTRIAPLFARSFPAAHVYGVRRGQDHVWQPPASEAVDCHIAAGSLPRHLRRTLDEFPTRRRYLVPDSRKVAAWRERFAACGDGLYVGIAWRGGAQADDRMLRWTQLEQWRDVLSIGGVRFINLQYGDCRDDLTDIRRQFGVEVHHWDDFDPTINLDGLAAQIAALDLVISVGNASVHMAGAVGTTAWGLIPRYRGWRWMTDTETTPWYSSVRLYRQAAAGQWGGVFKRIRQDLLNLVDQVDDSIERRLLPRPHMLSHGAVADDETALPWYGS